ncbi:MAG: tetratricopeptide repeat protein [Bacteroidia bacterium]
MALVFEDQEEEYQLNPIILGAEDSALGGFQAIALHLEAEIRLERLRKLESQLRLQVKAGMTELMDDLGIVQMQLGKETIAIHTLNKAIAAGSEEAFYPLGQIYLAQSLDARDRNTRWNAAVNHLREATQVDSKNAGAWLHLGKALIGLVKEESLQQVSIAYEHYLNVGAPLGQTDEINAFLISQDPLKQRKENIIKGQEALADGKYQRSISAFEKAIQLGDKESYFFLGTAFEAAGNFARALDAYQRAYSLGVRPEEVALRLGRTIVSLRTKPDLIRVGMEAITPQVEGRAGQSGAVEESEELEALLKQLEDMYEAAGGS